MSDILFDLILSGDIEDIRLLLRCGGWRLNDVFSDGSTPLNVAISNHRYDVALLLIENGSDVNQPDSFRVDGSRRKPIHSACAAGSLDLVRLLVEKRGVHVDVRDCGSSSPLHHAASRGNIDIVEYLLSVGCDVNSRSNSGRSALWKAAEGGHLEIVHLLHAIGASLDIQNQVGETLLFHCCRSPHLTDVLTDLVHLGVDLSTRDIEGNQALHSAAIAGNTFAVETLTSAGSRINPKNDSGNTPLHNAVIHGRISVTVLLLNLGADFDHCNCSGQSALYAAMLHSRTDIVNLLYDVGARLTLKEVDMFEVYESRRNERKVALYRWCLTLFNSPMRLSSVCRLSIRRHLADVPLSSVARLQLPVALQQYLLLADFVALDTLLSA